ncbi:MAG: DUF5343 domain-containing protein ['Candidatus Kapabacteria' thiocyanatum]|uniref:DUF5343 domain-containing protein n=1 Tax=Candidatus Kapaibacterium thiocyanatum TaxID=1895771 RepID=A0A1M3L5Z7_9BACT|nr:DUF5343 domain-containing protein ['Candidatus Kapabacteria' thiocyanatum]OJX60977.1 MAG: hypothetical protein BGO89_04720 ['Candidatus Kapabacteria' thiocyanatum]
MADKHPYVSGTGVLIQVFDHLKKSFPQTLKAEVLKQLGFAPQNESYVLNVIRYLRLIDNEGARTEAAQRTFTLHDSGEFERQFSDMIKSAYEGLFSLHGDDAWNLEDSKLITFFRQTDQSSELVGKRQAGTFKALATYAGHAKQLPARKTAAKKSTYATKAKQVGSKMEGSTPPALVLPAGGSTTNGNISLAVRVEINLPTTGDQDVYDKIFRSIRDNLLSS